jgi:hypothetical protein
MVGKIARTLVLLSFLTAGAFAADQPEEKSSDLSYKIWENYDKVQWVKAQDGKRSVFFEFDSRKERHWVFTSAPERTAGDLEVMEKFVFETKFSNKRPSLNFGCTQPQVSRSQDQWKEYFYDLSQCSFSIELTLWGKDKAPPSPAKASAKKNKKSRK